MLKIIDKADTNGDGYIDIAEWHTVAISHRAKLSKQQLKWAFNFFDIDGCGHITVHHFKKALKIPDDQFDEKYWN
jgi:Ca2+-binding EF-hand superfamily protein